MRAQRPLNPAAVQAANESLWANNPELAGRQLTMEPGEPETTYRKEWMAAYQEALAEGNPPPPTSGDGDVGDPSSPCPPEVQAELVVSVTRSNDGSPVHGADVQIEGPVVRNGTTDASGVTTFSGICPGGYTVTGTKANHTTDTTTKTVQPATTDTAELVLDAEVDLVVTVIDQSTGDPISGATVRLSGPETAQSRTDPSGEARFIGIPTGDYQIQGSRADYRPGTTTQTVAEGSTPVELQLTAVAGLGGVVLDADTRDPIPNAEVSVVSDRSRRATSDASGEFDLGEVDPGEYQLEATATDYGVGSARVTVGQGTSQPAQILLNRAGVAIRAADGTSAPPKVVPVGKSVLLKGVPSVGAAGTYQWSTTSAKLTLSNATSQTVTVTAGATHSATLDAEQLTLVFTPAGSAALPAVSTQVTVIKVVFSESAAQRYGYDNMDNAAGVDHHVSVRRNDSTTVTVTIQGGASGDVLSFTSDDPSTADATPPASPGVTFDLTVNGKAQDKLPANVHARANDASGPICATIVVNVYKEKSVTGKVAKIVDSTVAATSLRAFDVEAAETAVNGWWKQVVATIDLTDHDAVGNSIDVRYDINNNGVLDLEPGGIVSAEEQAIRNAFNPTGQKVVIVKDLAWMYFLKIAAAIDDTTLTLKDAYAAYMQFIHVGNSYDLGTGANKERVTISAIAGTVVTLSAKLSNAHPTTDGLLFGLNGLSGNPIFVKEKGLSEAQQRQVIGHENGHNQLNFLDLTPTPLLMHHSTQTRTDTKIRFKDQPRHHAGGNENQWETVPR